MKKPIRAANRTKSIKKNAHPVFRGTSPAIVKKETKGQRSPTRRTRARSERLHLGPNDPQALGSGNVAVLPGGNIVGNVQITNEDYTLEQDDRVILVAAPATITLNDQPLSGFPVWIIADGGMVTVDGPIQGGPSTIMQGFVGIYVQSPSSGLWSLVKGASPSSGTIEIENQSIPLGPANILDFSGAGVTATLAGVTATITIPGSGPQPFIFDTTVGQTNIVANRIADNSPVNPAGTGIFNAGSDTTGATVGAVGNWSSIGGGDQNVTQGTYDTVSGGENNVTGTTGGSTIAGGTNHQADNFSAIGGGNVNVATGEASTVAGGAICNALANFSGALCGSSNFCDSGSEGSVIGGGEFGFIIGSTHGVIAGGNDNEIFGNNGVISGGSDNIINNQFGAVGGGNTNTVSGDYGFVAGGSNNTAWYYGHAEGFQCNAGADFTNDACHAEGDTCTSNGLLTSHAEGYGCIADGELGCHAEGQQTHCSSRAGHTEGEGSICAMDAEAGHAEGYHTAANNIAGHAEGGFSQANGISSHAEGQLTMAGSPIVGFGDHAEGQSTSAVSVSNTFGGAHAEGSFTNASNDGAHSEGIETNASGFGSHTEGVVTFATGDGAHAEGNDSSTANGEASHAEGSGSVASFFGDHAEGVGTEASSVAEGGAHAEGTGTSALNDGAHAEGANCTAMGFASHAEGSHCRANFFTDHAEGQNCTATSTASGSAHAEGFFCQALADASHAQNENTTALGEASTSEGFGTIATGLASHSYGESSNALREGQQAYSCAPLAADGPAGSYQQSLLTLNARNPGGTGAPLVYGEGSTQFTLESGKAYKIVIEAIAQSATDFSSFDAVISCSYAGAAIVFPVTPPTPVVATNATATAGAVADVWTLTFTDGGGGILTVTFSTTTQAANISAGFRFTEVTHP
jgi:hypothetical protein